MRPRLPRVWGDSLKPEAVGLLGVLGIWGADRPGEVQGKGHHGALQHREQPERQWGWLALPSPAAGVGDNPTSRPSLCCQPPPVLSPPAHLEAVPAVLVEAQRLPHQHGVEEAPCPAVGLWDTSRGQL